MHWKDLGFVATHWVWILLAVFALAVIEVGWKSKRMQTPPMQWMKGFTAFLRWLLVAVMFSVILVATRPLRNLESTSFDNRTLQPSSSASGGNAGQTSGDAIKANIDELKWLLTLLAGFAVITAIAQAASAWISALTYDKQASAKLQEIEKVLESFKARYPLFDDVDEKRNLAHDALSSTLRRVFAVPDPEADPMEAIFWIRDFYHEIELEKRQLLLSVESFASVDLHPPRKGSEVQNLKLFAVFYHAKFRYEKGMKAAALFTDLERAESYLLLALRKAPSDFTLHNELGNVYLTMRECAGGLSSDYPNYQEKARDAFLKSLSECRDQQRVYYNLAFIQSYYDKRFDKARDLLQEGVKHNKWQRVTTPKSMAAYVYYNLGCCEARILVGSRQKTSPIDMDEAKPAISALRSACEIAPILAEDVERDFTDKAEGDIYELFDKGNAEVRAELVRIQEALIAERMKKPQQGFTETVAEAMRMIWDSAKEMFKNRSQVN